MISFNIDGLDKLQKQLKNMEKASRELANTNKVSFDELFTDSFMKEYTNFATLDEMMKSFGYSEFTQQEFESIPDDEINQKVSNSTSFDSWQDMLNKAGELYALRKLGF